MHIGEDFEGTIGRSKLPVDRTVSVHLFVETPELFGEEFLQILTQCLINEIQILSVGFLPPDHEHKLLDPLDNVIRERALGSHDGDDGIIIYFKSTIIVSV